MTMKPYNSDGSKQLVHSTNVNELAGNSLSDRSAPHCIICSFSCYLISMYLVTHDIY